MSSSRTGTEQKLSMEVQCMQVARRGDRNARVIYERIRGAAIVCGVRGGLEIK